MFLSLTSVVGRSRSAVAESLANYARSVGGGMEQADLPIDDDHCFVVLEANGNTTVFNSYSFMEWDESSAFISKDLNAPVFSFHIHDGDLWMYILYVNGQEVDRFNPIPDYWEDNMDIEEMASWAGDATVVTQYVPWISRPDIGQYLVRWDLEADEVARAYPDDEYIQEDWQLLDFMRKLALPYPLDGNGRPAGDTYKFWTKELPIKIQPPVKPAVRVGGPSVSAKPTVKKPWWKFW